MALPPAEKTRRARERLLNVARQYTVGTYVRKFVAPIFQRMIRAEAAVEPSGFTPAVVEGEVRDSFRPRGYCVCVTCGNAHPWTTHAGLIQTGHFLGSRCNSILFEEDNVAPQCVRCNGFESGAPQRFRAWMLAVRGEEVVERLEALKRTTREFTRDELVDMRIEYAARLKAAEERMKEAVEKQQENR